VDVHHALPVLSATKNVTLRRQVVLGVRPALAALDPRRRLRVAGWPRGRHVHVLTFLLSDEGQCGVDRCRGPLAW
jgi:hypothetical protein